MPLKLFLHEKIKADLQELADKSGLPLSQFVREVLVSHFLEHTLWSERNVLLTSDQQEVADGWENVIIEEKRVSSLSSVVEVALKGKVKVLHW